MLPANYHAKHGFGASWLFLEVGCHFCGMIRLRLLSALLRRLCMLGTLFVSFGIAQQYFLSNSAAKMAETALNFAVSNDTA